MSEPTDAREREQVGEFPVYRLPNEDYKVGDNVTVLSFREPERHTMYLRNLVGTVKGVERDPDGDVWVTVEYRVEDTFLADQLGLVEQAE